MSTDDFKRLNDIFSARLKKQPSIKEVRKAFEEAGFLNKKGKVKEPYKQVFLEK